MSEEWLGYLTMVVRVPVDDANVDSELTFEDCRAAIDEMDDSEKARLLEDALTRGGPDSAELFDVEFHGEV